MPVSGELAAISGLDTAGLSAQGEEQHYVRPAMVEQWRFLVSSFVNRHKMHAGIVMYYNHLLVGGPPGTGKSSTTWLWCQWMARVQGATILWLHKAHGPGGSLTIRLLNTNSIVTYQYGTDFTTPDSRNNLIGRLTTDSVSVCVLDGVTVDEDKDVREMLEGWLNYNRRDRLLVYCASVAVHLKAEVGVRNHSVPSWLREEYAAACHVEAFWEAVQGVMGGATTGDDLEDGDAGLGGAGAGGAASAPAGAALVDSKFFIAGHCARWMFGLSTDSVMELIATHISTVDSFSALLDNDMGESTNRQVNHLRATLANGAGHQNVFVSEYVARTLSQQGKVEVQFMNRLNRFANRSGNPTFLGRCVEFDFLLQLRVAAETDGKVQLLVGDSDVAWSVSHCRSFSMVRDVAAMRDLTAGEWLIPMRFNQGAFDAVQLVDEGEDSRGHIVRFINVRCGGSHGVKSAYLYSMMKALRAAGWLEAGGKPSLEFYFVRPGHDKQKEFRADLPTQHGSLTSQFDWPNRERKHAFFQRTLEGAAPLVSTSSSK